MVAPLESTVIYDIDHADRIVTVNEAWTLFALANDAPDLSAPGILGVSLWSAITDPTTRELYRGLLTRVRAGAEIEFRFRCDAPAMTREMVMRVSHAGGGRVRFTSRVAAAAARPPQRVLDRRAARTHTLIRVCGWCKRIAVGEDRWEAVELAMPLLGMDQAGTLPGLTHGICPACYQAALIDVAGAAH